MRQIFSVRFFAAVGAVVVLLAALAVVFGARRVIDDGRTDAGRIDRRVDFVDRIESSSNPSFSIGADGLAATDTRLTIDASRAMTIVAGTPGVDHCGQLAFPATCAIVADLLGEAVVWFAFVPAPQPGVVRLPPVESLEDGIATLVNGWKLPHAPAFERRCGDEVFESFRQFRQVFGDDYSTEYSLIERSLTAVICRERVPFAPTTTIA